jgi:outer membrane protein insertion porin family
MHRILHTALTALILGLVLNVPVFSQELQGDELTRWLRKRPNVNRLAIEGNQALGDGDIRSVMEVRSPGMLARLHLRSKPRLFAVSMRRDEVSIRDEYLRRGYWSASVSITAQPDEKRDEAAVRVTVTEGSQSHWGDVTFEGDHDELVWLLSRRAARLKRGAPADSLLLAYFRSQMRAECANHARPAATIDATATPRGDTVDVRFRLVAGPYVVLGDLTIDGLKHTGESTVRRELRLHTGDPYSRKRLDERQQDIYATGLFTFVNLGTEYADTNFSAPTRTANMNLRVIERKPTFIGFRTGAGQDPDFDLTWDYAVEWGSRNWLGSGRKWTLTAQSRFVVVTEWRIMQHRFSARYVEPWILGLRLPTALEVAFEPIQQFVRSPTQIYDEEITSVELSVNRRFKRSYRVWSSLEYERVTILDIPDEERESYLADRGEPINRRWSFTLERDTRPNLFVPTSGARSRIYLEYVGGILGGKNDYYEVDLSWARFQTVNAPSVFASRIRVAWQGVHSGEDAVPIDDRLYLGGANSIRGYSEKAVGQFDESGTALGGKVVLLANLELRTPVKGKFWFTLFGDAGNNWLRYQDVSLRETLVSIGIGWQYIAPVGPIRLDYARRVIHPGHPKSDRLHLSILFAF